MSTSRIYHSYNLGIALKRAIEIATEAHQGQLDKAGRDYIEHPLRVMEMGKTEEEKIVGVLHDVIEDTAWTFEALANEGFSKEIIDALNKLYIWKNYNKNVFRKDEFFLVEDIVYKKI